MAQSIIITIIWTPNDVQHPSFWVLQTLEKCTIFLQVQGWHKLFISALCTLPFTDSRGKLKALIWLHATNQYLIEDKDWDDDHNSAVWMVKMYIVLTAGVFVKWRMSRNYIIGFHVLFVCLVQHRVLFTEYDWHECFILSGFVKGNRCASE